MYDQPNQPLCGIALTKGGTRFLIVIQMFGHTLQFFVVQNKTMLQQLSCQLITTILLGHQRAVTKVKFMFFLVPSTDQNMEAKTEMQYEL